MKAILIKYNGKEWSLPDLARAYGITPQALYGRVVKHGWDVERALATPMNPPPQKYAYKGRMYSVKELSDMHGGVSPTTMANRLKKMSVEEALTMPNTRPKAHTYGGDKKIKAEQQKELKPKRIPEKPDITLCVTCRYHGGLHSGNAKGVYCDYIGVENHRRPCPPGKDCTVYVKGPSLVRAERLRSAGILVRE